MISWPAHIKPGTVDRKSVVTALDMVPTLAKMAGVTLPVSYHGDGINRSEVFMNKPSARKEDMYWEYGRNSTAFNFPKGKDKSPNLAIRSGNWKLLMNNDGTDIQLYNLLNDPKEAMNVAADNPTVTDELKAKLIQWWRANPRLKK
jgi:arylsulfatase A-like enzyme